MGQLNIKDAALIAKVKALAERRQTSMVEVIRQAVEDAEAREEARVAERLAAIREITRRSALLVPPGTTSDHSDLYDENGLPK
jgi:antitoxin VapB